MIVQVTSLGAPAAVVLTVTSSAHCPPTAQPPLGAISTDFTSPAAAGPKLGVPLGRGVGWAPVGRVVGTWLAGGGGVMAAVRLPPALSRRGTRTTARMRRTSRPAAMAAGRAKRAHSMPGRSSAKSAALAT